MAMIFHFAFVLVDNFVYSSDFVIGIYYYTVMPSFVLEEKFVLIVVFVHFLCMDQKDLIDKWDLID